MGLKVGLDFGTSNSGVAIFDGQHVRQLPVDPGSLIPEVTRTVLYITRDHRSTIGQEAIELYSRDNINRQRRYVKQWAGEIDFHGAELDYVRDIFVLVDELKPGRLLQYLKTALRKDDYPGTQVFDRFYPVSSLVQIYLAHLKKRAENLLGQEIEAVTLGRPVRFSSDPQKDQRAEDLLRQAANEAGFKRVDFELEPVAAALDYEQSLLRPENAVIFDFGGGTLDIAVMRLGEGSKRQIYASGGVDIAGSDFDRAIIEKRMLPFFGLGKVNYQPEIQELIRAVPDWIALPELATPMNRATLEKAVRAGLAPVRLRALEAMIYNDLSFTFYNRVEAAKITLSSSGAAVISMEDKDIALWELYTRHQFEKDIAVYLEQVERVLMDTLAESGLEPGQIDAVVKTGGSSNIPLFHGMLVRLFGAAKVRETNSFTSVTAGLAIRAGRKSSL